MKRAIWLVLCFRPGNFDFFFFNDTATTEIYTLSLHDALPIYVDPVRCRLAMWRIAAHIEAVAHVDRKSTRLNSSHGSTSYAVFCLKKKTRKSEEFSEIESTSVGKYLFGTPRPRGNDAADDAWRRRTDHLLRFFF